MKSISIVEDEKELLEQISNKLNKDGFKVNKYASGEEILQDLDYKKPDLILLDLMLPGINGLDICKKIKNNPKKWDIPVILLSARGHEIDIISGLESGADDYITKPFNERILLARIKNMLEKEDRKKTAHNSTIKFKDLVINPEKHEVLIDNKPVILTTSEFKVLHFLLERKGCVFSRYQIIESVRKDDYLVNDRSIDVLLGRLRKKLGSYGQYIETVYGIGYRFNDEKKNFFKKPD